MKDNANLVKPGFQFFSTVMPDKGWDHEWRSVLTATDEELESLTGWHGATRAQMLAYCRNRPIEGWYQQIDREEALKRMAEAGRWKTFGWVADKVSGYSGKDRT